jgi:hypothetical protein
VKIVELSSMFYSRVSLDEQTYIHTAMLVSTAPKEGIERH